MHEMSLCENILGILLDEAASQNFSKVDRVCLEVGPLSGVEPEALRFGFDVVTRGSLADGARLDIFEPEATATCAACGTTAVIQDRFDPCPSCGSHLLKIKTGEELRIKELEVS
ncbi:hydrogenase maturation nickel metallochaperone HypA [Roseibium sp.]|uniref:hydrogenase maturation nickel metallochaperone HypA n=1 Tax=Roseibium sp. TaxID=1936156 RepID=UPI003BAAE151